MDEVGVDRGATSHLSLSLSVCVSSFHRLSPLHPFTTTKTTNMGFCVSYSGVHIHNAASYDYLQKHNEVILLKTVLKKLISFQTQL